MTVAERRKYAKLDDIGFVGFQENRSKAEIKKDAARTARIIKVFKAKKKTASAKKRTTRSILAK